MSSQPTPTQLKKAREDAGLTTAQASDAVHVDIRTWQYWESGATKMPAGLWELFLIKTGQQEATP